MTAMLLLFHIEGQGAEWVGTYFMSGILASLELCSTGAIPWVPYDSVLCLGRISSVDGLDGLNCFAYLVYDSVHAESILFINYWLGIRILSVVDHSSLRAKIYN